MKWLLGILIILLFSLQYSLWFGSGGIVNSIKLNQQIALQKLENKKLEDRNNILIAEVQDLKEGQSIIEEHAREDLGLIKPNETFYQLVK